jgi:hypothetical protein
VIFMTCGASWARARTGAVYAANPIINPKARTFLVGVIG